MSDRTTNTRTPRIIDAPLGIGIVLTITYYMVIFQESFKDTLLFRYTTQHLVEYAITGFFLWGVTDIVFHIARFPIEMRALRQEWLPRGRKRESVSRVAGYREWLESRPAWLRRSRIGQRYAQVLAELEDKGSAEDLDVYLRHLADMDFEQTQVNYGLLRFLYCVMPMFGFLGTVVHFGTALSGHTSGEITNHLSLVMGEMGTAFNTTTAALTAAMTMMFGVFLCERIERGIVASVDHRVEQDLANRFECSDASVAPFVDVVRQCNQSSLDAQQTAMERQIELWAATIQRLEQRFAAHDREREERLTKLLEALHTAQAAHRAQLEPAAQEIAGCRAAMSKLVAGLGEILHGRGELVAIEANLAENLRLLRETQQIDQALHGLTGAIHLLTARGHGKDARAA